MLVLAPFAPHVAEELWQRLGHSTSLAYQPWPKADPDWLQSDEMTMTVHINGKRRAELQVGRTMSQAAIEEIARQAPGVADKLEGLTIKKIIYVHGKLVNFIV